MEISRKGIDYIGVTASYLCHDGEGNVVLSKRGVNCRDEHGRWDCGGGSVEFGHTGEETVRKEVKEEYCADALEVEFLGFRDVFREQDGNKTHWVSLDYKVLVDRSQVQNGEPHKFDDVRWFPFGQFPEPMHSQWPFFLAQYKGRLNIHAAR